jgi:molybdate transport system permease protein
MGFSDADLAAIWLTLKLATVTTLLLLLIGTPIAWRLARTRSWWKGPVAAVVALPLVLPPTVIGFYLLVAMGPNGPVGQFTQSLGLGVLPFTFWGLVVASVFYSMPFVVQPLQNAFEAIGERPLGHLFHGDPAPGPAGFPHRLHPGLRPHRGGVRRGAHDRRQHPR